jgi:hypothetical protein
MAMLLISRKALGSSLRGLYALIQCRHESARGELKPKEFKPLSSDRKKRQKKATVLLPNTDLPNHRRSQYPVAEREQWQDK